MPGVAIPHLPASLQGVVNLPANLQDPPSRTELGRVSNLANHAGSQRKDNIITDDDLGMVVGFQQEVSTAYGAAALGNAIALAVGIGPGGLAGAIAAAVGPAVAAAVGPAIAAALAPVIQRLDNIETKLNRTLSFAAAAHNRHQVDGNLPNRSFEVVPFTDGTMPPAALPNLVNIDIIRQLSDVDTRAYYRGYGGTANNLSMPKKREFIRVAVGCTVEL
ncbi:hypothetical protein B0H16DRAFT_1897470 [Mycena metata]|uniref:Mug135-like C-terminal domain-containing protein n=1 Tax=Mycena metata TaxID=1033252 RepID=A0AAD7HEI4_9AGAR|nr:hypothetical protein B0H16DRAFT_1897470 [Mycena metata]